MAQSWITDFLIANKHLLFSEKLTHFLTHSVDIIISNRGIRCLD